MRCSYLNPPVSHDRGRTWSGVHSLQYHVQAAADVQITASLADCGEVVLVNPLWLKTGKPTQDAPAWELNLAALAQTDRTLIAYADEAELLKFPGSLRDAFLACMDGVLVSNRYLQRALQAYVRSRIGVLYPPVDATLFTLPTHTQRQQLVVVGNVSLLKNTESILRFFQMLPNAFQKVFVGNCTLWGTEVYPIDRRLEAALPAVCEWIPFLPMRQLARLLRDAWGYLNMSRFDVCCMSFIEAALTGCACFVWDKHPFADEYPVHRFSTVQEGVALVQSVWQHTAGRPDMKLRAAMAKNHSYDAFASRLHQYVQEIGSHRKASHVRYPRVS